MTTTPVPARTQPVKAIVGAVGVLFVGVIAVTSAIAPTNDDPRTERTGTDFATRARSDVVMSPDAAEHWLAVEVSDVPMSPDAAEHWLAGEVLDVVSMSPDAAERWLAAG